jgi:hypothetical protein
MVAHTWNPSQAGSEDGRILTEGQPRKKWVRPILVTSLVTDTCDSRYVGGKGKMIAVEDHLKQKQETLSEK